MSSIKIEKFDYDYSQGFNKKKKATKIEVSFIGVLETKIHLNVESMNLAQTEFAAPPRKPQLLVLLH